MPSSIEDEQTFIDHAHSFLDQHINHLRSRISNTTSAPSTGTGQDELEREALLDNLRLQLHAAEAARPRMCFGRLRFDGGDDHHIGRIGMRDEAGDILLIDWRAPQAAPFYQATSKNPMDVVLRRRIATRPSPRGPHVTHVDDETFDGIHEAVDPSLSAMEAPRSGRMADILATIASDQDAIIRSDLDQVTIVQGGPGTGKTVVALHRAAWLLYTHRERLARDGVLIVGPSNVFLHYIDQVLPSLGETDVVLLTPRQLYPDVRPTADDAHDVARIKGSDRMARVIARAVAARVRIPRTGVTLTTHTGMRIRLSSEEIEQASKGISRSRRFHDGRDPFLRRVLQQAARNVASDTGHDPEDQEYCDDLIASMVEDSTVRREFNLMWLPTTAERIIGDLLADASILDEAATGILTGDERAALVRSPDAPWTTDDLPLLDEAADALGPWEPPSAAPPDVPDYRELQASDAYRIRPSHSGGNAGSLAERAIDDRDWIYGHVIVDEAQELSAMAWRAIRRRASRRSMTVVGDLQQSSHPAGPRTWEEALPWARSKTALHTLTVTYRITRQIADVATRLLLEAGGDPPVLTPIRDGSDVVEASLPLSELPQYAQSVASEDGRSAVIAPDALLPHLRELLPEPRFGFGSAALDAPIAVLSAQQAKGLEFDCVIVVDPDALSSQHPRGADIYVAATRATKDLHVLRVL